MAVVGHDEASNVLVGLEVVGGVALLGASSEGLLFEVLHEASRVGVECNLRHKLRGAVLVVVHLSGD